MNGLISHRLAGGPQMRWQGGKQSDNLEDRRRMSPGGMVAGGGVMVVIVLVMLCMGADPRQLLQLLQNVEVQAPLPGPGQPGGRGGQPETAEEARSREFAATILGYTEDVWDEQFRKAGEQYEPPK